MRYVISDIHGEYDLFVALLKKINFTQSDTIFICGDIIDKGNNSIKLARMISQMSNAKCILGNHEYDFLKYYWGLMRNSPSDFDAVLAQLQQYFHDDIDMLNWELVDWLESLPFYIEEDDFICVHAGVPLDKDGRIVPLEKVTPEQLVYDREFKEPSVQVKGGKCVFFGHTPTSYLEKSDGKIVAYLRPQHNGSSIDDYYKVHLDLGTWMSGMLGCFCIETCKCIYVTKKD